MTDNPRKPIVAANWKMNKTRADVQKFFSELIPCVSELEGVDIIVAPPYTALGTAVELASDNSILIAAQNMHYEDMGAFTGEISPLMLLDIGVSHVIIGHSERRHVFGEDDELVARKVHSAIRAGLIPVFCVGETREEREENRVAPVLNDQVDTVVNGLAPDEVKNIIVAYEPVWAIGTGLTAGPEQAQDAHEIIRKRLRKHFETTIADSVRILYGGSVNADNINKLMVMPDIDGVLVGGAALEARSFASILNFNSKE